MASLACLLSGLPTLSLSSVHTAIARSAGRGILDVLVLPTLSTTSSSSSTCNDDKPMAIEYLSSVWQKLPIELVFLVFELAACDSQPTALSLMLVSRSARKVITPMLYRYVRVCESKAQLLNSALASTHILPEHQRVGSRMRTLCILPDGKGMQRGGPIYVEMPNLRAIVDMRRRSMYADHYGIIELHITDHMQLQCYRPAEDQRRFANIIDLGDQFSLPSQPAPPHLEHLVVSLVAGVQEQERCTLESYISEAKELKQIDYVYTQKHHWRAQLHLWQISTSLNIRFERSPTRTVKTRLLLMPDEDLKMCASSSDMPKHADAASYARLLASLVTEPGRPQPERKHTPSAFWDYLETLTVTREEDIYVPI